MALPAGLTTTLVGPSGCGKSTLLQVIAGLTAPDAGTVALGGRVVTALAPEKRGAVLMGQDPALFQHMSVAGNVAFGLGLRGVPRAEVDVRVAELLERVRLPGFGARRPASLSGGEAQRVALARALAVRPAVLLLDEPFTALDPGLRETMRALVRELLRETGTTALLVTHDHGEAAAMGDRLAVMLDGRIARVGTPEDVFADPGSAAVARFLGANVIAGRVVAGGVETAFGRVALEGGSDGATLSLAIRPEAVRLGGEGPSARVTGVEFRGGATVVTLAAGEGETLVATLDPVAARGMVVGAIVPVELPAERVTVVRDVPRASA
nr:ABC transporter ATP-binding protein [Oharaeibacter diazotrophicus]